MSKTELIRDRLRADIVQGRYTAGDPISERAVADELAVSRIPVREALIQLERDGLVSIFPRRGACVRVLTADNMQSIYQTREALEGMAARLAAERMTPEILAHFRARYEALLDDPTGMDVESISTLGDRFHDSVIQGCRNSVIIEMSASIADRVKICRRLSYGRASGERALAAAREHLGIADAIRAGDAELAERRMREHIATWATVLRAHMAGDSHGPTPADLSTDLH